MAIYEYRCQTCGEEFEVMKSIKDDSLPTCTRCGGDQVVKMISQTSFILKGKGWYATDYGKGGASHSHPASCSCCSSSSSSPSPAAPAPDACSSGACGTSACPATGGSSHD